MDIYRNTDTLGSMGETTTVVAVMALAYIAAALSGLIESTPLATIAAIGLLVLAGNELGGPLCRTRHSRLEEGMVLAILMAVTAVGWIAIGAFALALPLGAYLCRGFHMGGSPAPAMSTAKPETPTRRVATAHRAGSVVSVQRRAG